MALVNDTLNEALSVEPLFEPERFMEAFFEFGYRLISLQRYWEFTRRYIVKYIEALKVEEFALPGTAEFAAEMEVFRDELLSDEDYFPEVLRGAVLAHGLALLETLLSDVASETAKDLSVDVVLDKRKIPNVNRYILFLTKTCGLDVDIRKELWKRLDAVRELRNRYIHKLDRQLPSEIRATLGQMVNETHLEDTPIDDAFVDSGLQTVAQLAERIETAYWQFYDRQCPEGVSQG